MKLLLVDDDPALHVWFRHKMLSVNKPWIRNAEVVFAHQPLENLEDYYQFHGAIFDYELGYIDQDGRRMTGLDICERIHTYQFAADAEGKRLRPQPRTRLMLLTGLNCKEMPIDAREYVDQIAYKHGSGYRHVDDAMSCIRALMRSIADSPETPVVADRT